MKGLYLEYEDREYRFVLDRFDTEVGPHNVSIVFKMYEGDIANKSYTVMKQDFISLDVTNVANLYRMLCVEINIDPSIVPDVMEI